MSIRASQDHRCKGNLTFVAHLVRKVSVGNQDIRLVRCPPGTSDPFRCCIGLEPLVQ